LAKPGGAASGKGAGSGWDLGAEVTAVMPFIRAGATVFDVEPIRRMAPGGPRPGGQSPLFLFEPQAMCVSNLQIDGAVLTQAAVARRTARSPAFSGRCGRQCFASRKKRYPFDRQQFKSNEVAVVSIDSFMEAHVSSWLIS